MKGIDKINPPRITTEPLNQELVSPLIASKLLITGVE